MSTLSAFPPSVGMNFTPTIHSRAEGPTDPTKNKPTGEAFIVCVTGAGKGLGYHISLAYAKAGATGLIISSRTQSDLDALTAELRTINPNLEILSQTCDTTSDADVERLAAAGRQRFDGRLDVCIANAGVISKYLADGTLPKGVLADRDFERVIDINLLGVVRTARHFVPLLLDSRAGAQAFVVVTSLAAHLTSSFLTPIAYNTSKIAGCRLAEHLQNDHGTDGLLAFAVHPGAVITPQTEKHHLEKGDVWDGTLSDDIGLCGGFLTWLTKEKREWLGGRYISVNWDVDELQAMKDDIVREDKLKFRMGI